MSSKSKKQVEAIVSGMGVFMAIITSLVELVKKFGGSMDCLYRLATPEGSATLEKIAQIIVGDIEKAPVIGKFFMTVKLGQYSTIDALRKAIGVSGKRISDYADQILGKISISATEEEIDLWEVTGAELGFTEAVLRKDIYKRAVELGFAICPAEAIALARIQCNDGKWRIGGMEPIIGSGGGLGMLGLNGGGGGLYLGAYYGGHDDLWDPDYVWLFVRPRRK